MIFHPFVAEQVEYGAFRVSAGVDRSVRIRRLQNVLDLDLSARACIESGQIWEAMHIRPKDTWFRYCLTHKDRDK